jgi:hypothetical protein
MTADGNGATGTSQKPRLGGHPDDNTQTARHYVMTHK